VGDDSKVSFWHDLWCGDKALKEGFLELYSRAHLEISSGTNQWNVSFVGATHDWNVDVFVSFFKVLYLVRVGQEGEDKNWRVPSKRWLFAVRSFCSVLVWNEGSQFHWKNVWRIKFLFRLVSCPT